MWYGTEMQADSMIKMKSFMILLFVIDKLTSTNALQRCVENRKVMKSFDITLLLKTLSRALLGFSITFLRSE